MEIVDDEKVGLIIKALVYRRVKYTFMWPISV